MGVLLEVIAASLEDAVEAEAGGAGRVELVAGPEHGGLTPALELLEMVLEKVNIPVRVMLRDQASMSVANARELSALEETAAAFARLPIDGLVAGFVRDGLIDQQAMKAVSQAAPGIPITFHRAFDVLGHPLHALDGIKELSQVDRILTRGMGKTWRKRLQSGLRLQEAAAPDITIVLAAGRDAASMAAENLGAAGLEIHVGRAARNPQTPSACVSRVQVAELKRALDRQN